MLSITIILCIAIGFVSYQAFERPELQYKLAHRPYSENVFKEYHRWLTSIFVHKDFSHLFLNLFVLWQLGTHVEVKFVLEFGQMGRVYYVLLFFLSGIFANIPTYFQYKNNDIYSALGASGAVAGVLMAYVLFEPWQWFIFPPVPGFLLGIGYIIYSSWADKHANDNIGHSAHLYGALFGLWFTISIGNGVLTDFLEKMAHPEPPPFF